VAVRVKALERHVGRFIVPFRNGDAISIHAFHQRAHVSWRGGPEAGMQERRRRLDVPHRCRARSNPSALRMMTVPSSYSWAVAGSKPN
jgi:hypothetical protein